MRLSFDPAALLAGDYRDWRDADWMRHITQLYAVDETEWMNHLLPIAEGTAAEDQTIVDRAERIVTRVRNETEVAHAVDKLLQEYSLDNEEGVILMCLAEALMRVPDAETADDLIRDKLSPADWKAHLGKSDSLFVNASTWGLLLTGKVTQLETREKNAGSVLEKLINRAGEPVIRQAMHQAMRIMGRQFVLGQSIKEALKNGKSYRAKGYTYSFDMLGEAAMTEKDAERYLEAYRNAIQSIIDFRKKWPDDVPLPTISIKLSALHPRYEASHEERVLTELADRVLSLLRLAVPNQIGVTIDAEEADRLELSLKLFRTVFENPEVRGFNNFGMVVQAYSKRALPVLGYLASLARRHGESIPVRLVKGAYWDSEIKFCQQLGTQGYPVYTRKENTDVAYLACARYLLGDEAQQGLFPQFATHNAHTVAAIETLGKGRNFEFQRLHGMGDALYDTLIEDTERSVRIYAPVGVHKDLLPYLVRRLLENGANSSFVHRLVDARTPVSDLIESPVMKVRTREDHKNTLIPLPPEIYGPERRNAKGHNLMIDGERSALMTAIEQFREQRWTAKPLIGGKAVETQTILPVTSPQLRSDVVGEAHYASAEHALEALEHASKAFSDWYQQPAGQRAAVLERMADLLEENEAEMIALCGREAGKTLQDGIDEVREAVDFCRFYAREARHHFSEPMRLPGPTGESNELYYEGRGVFLCISPWNFPLAIFLGQISAALVAGNAVIAKPAETTSLIAARAVELYHQAGAPATVLQLLPGEGAVIGGALIPDERITGVAFTGSTETAHRINRQLAERTGAIPTLIAETGGQNAMIVDSTALPEQVITDVLHSAFASAGQRCSALRILCVQEDIAPRVMELLTGAMDELTVGDPTQFSTDVGPVIDEKARQGLADYIEDQKNAGKLVHQVALPEACQKGTFIAPTVLKIGALSELGREQFGPVLHVMTYKSRELDQVIAGINDTGYGLTLGIHTRNEATAAYIEKRVRVGNCYVNRNQIGAVVGVQPFGGRGLSGTGPKAGGPNYVLRFATERTRTINTTAVGGNATLLSLSGDA
ncbi:MAG: bifunctional proline dehydrogenase/L-glutamate gamma-semialdehyde dehydrogenase PutA [Natronospirillum sp.]|uniref:bifunctional proline dehydrogenase/L-glutamate gamma-semialdehyde dehydrogenase PutA n=1 Tax=Natronospirillum sp. TaxID=2812955 RepID=UPI0025FDA03B|nr:bifunctional proline dehydrogenase/L-glutamate gamma-semialdehyde dehydrogenase PutA [Natronospirillum sp.]MCH8550988.1 bifunctional proline dehydrogenase/L-glutamate gamma-semialdehyde dehydrogenase PutA [Natronospirillum sp.]